MFQFHVCTRDTSVALPCMSGKHKMSSLYEDFLSSAGKWRNSMVYKCIKSTSRNGRRGIRRWLTRSQLEAHFQDSSIVDAIIVRKETDDYLKKTEIRDHPDCPGPTGVTDVSVQCMVLLFCQCSHTKFPRRTDSISGAGR